MSEGINNKENALGFHLEEGVYVCQRCGKKCAWQVNMIRHVLEHIKEEEEGGGNGNRGKRE